LEPVPVGVAGHLYIGGDGLARDYLNRPELTAERFIPNPFAATPGARMYQSGDLARYLADGSVEYLGRSDDQVKIRGLRIELGEIQARLAALAQVRETAVIVREDSPGDKRLVAYLVRHDADAAIEILLPTLRAALQQSLPDYMVPAHFVVMESLPLTPNGKVDRRALPAPDATRSEAEHVAPRSDTEAALCDIWSEVLKVDRVGVTDDFFLLGGHSLMATQMASHIRLRFGITLSLRALFESRTVAMLACQVEQAVSEAAQAKAAQTKALSAKVQNALANMSDEEIIALALEKRRQKAAQQLKDTEHE
jgi:acyl carrier protein